MFSLFYSLLFILFFSFDDEKLRFVEKRLRCLCKKSFSFGFSSFQKVKRLASVKNGKIPQRKN
ncbi:hypothetical protein A7Q10_05945 [Methylacidiphilum caldifontis]|uniref:Uncharacterized protein n=1 Tax=Methylacidiphilum caldifontis TaxID=2795386 RepID=A0A4Y8PFE7_9BACT|nr:hypothetical protein A7Q10_05945 [Methylacidiphilum caldifontis]